MAKVKNFSADDKLLQGARRLKFVASEPGVADLTSRGWSVLATFGPLEDGLTYTLLGQVEVALVDAQAARIKELEAALAAKG